jgi:dipeptidyl aminopeptidase/acylaminoacyl peptidase
MRLSSASLIALSFAFASAAVAQAPAPSNARQLTAERMWALKRLGDPAITPDGTQAVIPVTAYDIAENKGLTDLWMLPLAGGPARQLTSDKASDTQATVSPDGKWISFV